MLLTYMLAANEQEYRHIVLVIYSHDTQRFGALGLSRRAELMDKPLVYESLADLVSIHCYL